MPRALHNGRITRQASIPGEVWCAAGRFEQGLKWLGTWIGAATVNVADSDPEVARVKAVAALCALRSGDRVQAIRWAEQSRLAFQAQPRVSDWYKAPLETFDVFAAQVDRPNRKLNAGGRNFGDCLNCSGAPNLPRQLRWRGQFGRWACAMPSRLRCSNRPSSPPQDRGAGQACCKGHRALGSVFPRVEFRAIETRILARLHSGSWFDNAGRPVAGA